MSSQLTGRLSRFSPRTTRAASLPFGLNAAEIAAAAVALLFLVAVAIYYFTSLRPEQQRLAALEQQYETHRKVLLDEARGGSETPEKTRQQQEQEALDSLNQFKGNRLKSLNAGRIALLDEVNALAKKNGVQLASGIEMKTESGNENPAEGKKKTKEKKKDELYQYPMLDIKFTVVGPYDKLRAFINELQHNRQFLIINSINLQAEKDVAAGVGTSRRGRQAATGISLAIEASAYFQPREN